MNKVNAEVKVSPTGAGRAIGRLVPLVMGAAWLWIASSNPAVAQKRDSSGKAWDPMVTLGAEQTNAVRPLSHEQLKWCIEKAEIINLFKGQLEKRKVSLEKVKQLVTAERESAKRSEVGPGEPKGTSDARERDQAAISEAADALEVMETYDIACAGRPFPPRIETAVLKELRLRANPMRLIPYPATGLAPVAADDHLTTGRPPLSDVEKAEAAKYHSYLMQSITDRLKSDAPALTHGQVRVKMRIAPSGALMSRAIALSSGDAALDTAVLSAVDHAGPFDPPPYVIAYSPSDIVATITFADVGRD